MGRLFYRGGVGVVALVLLLASGVGAQKPNSENKNKYKDIEIMKFDVKQGVEFPEEHLGGMMDEIVKELQELKKFNQVFRATESQTDSSAPTLRLEGTVIEYKKGSQAKRYLVGFGAGKTKVVAHVKFIDKATGNVVFEKDVDGKVVLGFLGGKSKTSLRDVGKEIAEVSKKQFF
jgi:hypothetical protein